MLFGPLSSWWMRSPGLSFTVLSLSVLSVLLHRIQKDVLWRFQIVSGLDAHWHLQLMLQVRRLLRSTACFQRIQDTDLDSPHLIGTKPGFPLLPCLSPLLYTPNLKLREDREHPAAGKMFTPQTTFHQGPLWFTAPFRVDIRLMEMCKRKGCHITVMSRGGRYTNL